MSIPLVTQTALNEDARLVILKELASQENGCLHSGMLHRVLQEFGHRGSREWVHSQLNRLQDIGGIVVKSTGSVVIAHITHAGLDHVTGSVYLAGVAKPSKAID